MTLLTDNKTSTAILKLFKAVLIEDSQQASTHTSLNARTLPNGYVFDPRISDDMITDAFITQVTESIGISATQANQAFHKSWQTICDSTQEQLAIQQITHYMTTYGFESMGIYDADSVFIPNEVLQIPELNPSCNRNSNDDSQGVTLQVIKAITFDELVEKVTTLASGIALAEQTLDELMIIIRFMVRNTAVNKSTCSHQFSHEFSHKFNIKAFTNSIGNRELQTRLCTEYNIAPTEPVAFLRHVIFTVTGDSLLIKNKRLIDKIKATTDNKVIKKMDRLFLDAPDNLASIFLRYKPLFLALKSISKNKTIFNRLRKQAKTQHQPLPTDYLNSITHAIKMGNLNMVELEQRLASASIYRKIRLANALLYRMSVAMTDKRAKSSWNQADSNSIVYRVRNGRGWATEFTWQMKHYDLTEQAYQRVVASIAESVRDSVAGKTFYIPDNVHYTMPATEKQFTGNFPTGSWVSVPNDLIVGIHWQNALIHTETEKLDDSYDVELENFQQLKNVFKNKLIKNKRNKPKEYRVDLDLSLIGLNGSKIGWNANHYSPNQDMIFSGDMTDAPNPQGATELFYIKQGIKQSQALMVNYFNFSAEHEVPCKLIVAKESIDETSKLFQRNYIVDPNNIVMQTQFHLSERQNMLGLINQVAGENRIYFANMNLGTSIASYGDEHTKHAQQYLLNISENVLMLREVLEKAGATVITDIRNHVDNSDSNANATDVNVADVNVIKTADKANAKKPQGLLASLMDSLTGGVGKSNAVNNQCMETETMKTKMTEVADIKATNIIDLSPANIDKTTFIELLKAS